MVRKDKTDHGEIFDHWAELELAFAFASVIYGSVPDSAEPISVDGVTIAPSDRISILGFTLDSKLQPRLTLPIKGNAEGHENA